jgi:uncharacterized membrane protein YdbT with pleckstrin-like domain
MDIRQGDARQEMGSMAADELTCPTCGTRIAPGVELQAETTEYEAHPVMFASRPVAFVLTIVLCFVAIGLPILLIWWLRCLGTTLTVTDRRLILRQGLLSRNTNEVFHRDVRNVQVRQTFFQRLMGVGAVAVSSSGQSGVEIEVADVPDPRRVEALINRHRG